MEHTNSLAGWFYFNPCRDVLWFSFDFTDDLDGQTWLRDLESCYGEQLSTIETVFVEELEWNVRPHRHSSRYLKPLSGLKTILLLLDGDDEDDDNEEEGTEEGAAEEDEENDDPRTQNEDDELRERVDELRAEYADFLEHKDGTRPKVVCMDRTGTIY
jgi:hypothetical protein